MQKARRIKEYTDMPKESYRDYLSLPVPDEVSPPTEDPKIPESVREEVLKSRIKPTGESWAIPKVGDTLVMRCGNHRCINFYYLTDEAKRDHFGYCCVRCKEQFERERGYTSMEYKKASERFLLPTEEEVQPEAKKEEAPKEVSQGTTVLMM